MAKFDVTVMELSTCLIPDEMSHPEAHRLRSVASTLPRMSPIGLTRREAELFWQWDGSPALLADHRVVIIPEDWQAR